MIRGYKIRIYPTKEQEQKIWQHIGACRYIWNYMLDMQDARHKNNEKRLSAYGMIKLLKPLKNDGEHGWLYEVSNHSLQRVCKDLDHSYSAFFNKTAGFPKYKSRKNSKSAYPIRSEVLYFLNDKLLNIEKIGKVKYRSDYKFKYGRYKQSFLNAGISYNNGKWYLSFSCECENQAQTLTDISMGIDLGIKELAVVEFGNECIVFHNINKSKKVRKLKDKIKRLQRSICRKYEANRVGRKYIKTNNIIKEENELRRLFARVANIRKNYIHQSTHRLVSMRPSRVVMEDIVVSDMIKNRSYSKLLSEQCFHEFIRQMRYKCGWNGIDFLQADRFYPSSKICSHCGSIKKELNLSDRVYVCHNCGCVIDRDYNAAINLSRYVVQPEMATA